MDLVVLANDFPKAGETIIGHSFFTNPGGKGANQAVAIAKMGGDVEMVGVVGEEFNEVLMKTLSDYRVSTKHIRHQSTKSTGTATIVVSNGDNRIIINPGANFAITEEDVAAALKDAKPGDALVCQLEIPIHIVEYALKLAKAKEMITFLNPAPSALLSSEIFKSIDYLLPNQTETELYTDIFPHNIETAKQAAHKLLKMGVKHVLITMGDKGAYYTDATTEYFKASYKVPAVDTTGAGDTYIGTFVTMLTEGKQIEEAMALANLAASITIQRFGAQKAIPYRHELEEK